MSTLTISLATLVLFPVWLAFAYITLRIGSHMEGHSAPGWFAVLVALCMPIAVGAAYIHFEWRFFWLNSIASAILIALPSVLVGAMAANMFRSLLPERSVPTTISPKLDAQLVPAITAPQVVNEAVNVAHKSARLMNYKGRPPTSTLSASVPQFRSEQVYVVAPQGAEPPVGFFNISPAGVELWELVSTDDLRPVRKLDFVKPDPKEEPDFWAISQVETLPNHRLVVAMRDGHREKLYVFDRTTLTLTPISTANVESRPPLELKTISEQVAILSYETHRVRRLAEVYYNYYIHFVLFTEQHPDGLEVLKLGIDVGVVRRWLISDNTLYLQVYDPRRSEEAAATWRSLELTSLIGRDNLIDRRDGAHHR